MLAALVCGLVASLSQPPLSWPVVLIVAFPGLYWLWSNAETPRRAFFIGWVGGIGYFGSSLIWIAEPFLVEPEKFAWLIPLAVIGMGAGMALFWAAAFLVARRLCPSGWGAPFAWAAALAGMEWLRGNILSGFPWSLPGYAWVETPAMQFAALVGIYGVTLWTFLAGGLLGYVLVTRGNAARIVSALAAVALIAAPFVYGVATLSSHPPVISATAPKVGLVQPNVAQRDKWKPELRQAHLNDLLSKTAELSRGGADIVIWPEAATPYEIDKGPKIRDLIAAALKPGGILLAGGIRFEGIDGERRAFNSLIAVGQDASVIDTYDKQHLVPFGETLPLESLLSRFGVRAMISLPGGFTSGKAQERSMTLGTLPPFVPMICYEAIFPAEIMRRAAKGDWLVQVTNDAWFGRLIGPYQHLAMARVRAIERGLPLARAANTGVSAMIDPRGRILASLPLNESGILLESLPTRGTQTLYALYEDLPFGLGLLICFGIAAAGRVRSTKQT